MTNIGNVHALFYSNSGVQTTTQKLLLDDKGVLKDKHYGKSIDRSVLITSLDSYELLKKEGICSAHGSLGENLLIDYNPYLFEIGTKLKVGSVVLEITVHCTLCKSLSKVDTKIPKLLKNDRGVFAKVIQSGSIEEGSNIYLYTESE